MKRRTAVVALLAGIACLLVLANVWPRGRVRPEEGAALGRGGAAGAASATAEAADPHAAELATPQFQAWARERRWQPEEMVPGRIVVCFAKGTTAERRRQTAARLGATLARDRAFRDGTAASVVALPASASLREAIEACRRLDGVRSAEPLFRTAPQTNDPDYPDQWALHNTGQTVQGIAGTPDADIDAPEAWAVETGSPTVVIAVIDTGADFLHPDLVPNTWFNPGETGGGLESNGADDDNNGYVDDWRGWDFIGDDNDPSYDPDAEKYDHGTGVALAAGGAANNQVAGAGVAWSCKLMHLPASNDFELSEAIRYAADNGARIINMSLGRYSASTIERQAIEHARGLGVLVCCACGNDGTNNDARPLYPASYDLDNILAVAGSDQDDRLWNSGPGSGSNYGATTVDLAAPGHNILQSPLGRTTLFEHDFHAATLFADDFDDNDFGANWAEGADPGDTSKWGALSGLAYAYDEQGAYDANARTWIQSRAFSTAGMAGVGLTYFYYVECEANDDFLSVEVQDGAGWHELRRHTSPTSGADAQGTVTVNLSPYAGPSTRVRFVWNTDGNNNDYLGAIVDDVSIVRLDGEWTTGRSSGTDGWVASADGEASANGDAAKPYSANAHSWIQATTAFNAVGAKDLQVYYELIIDSETSDDYLAVEVWDGATWREVDRVSGPDPNRPGGWSVRSALADATAHANAQMKVRFVWHSDAGGNNYYGAQVRHVEVTRLGGSEYDTVYGERMASYAEGTSVSSPLVAGVAALVWSRYPSLTYQEVRSTILASVDTKSSLAGKCVTGGRLNAHAALTYINHEPVAQDDTATVDQDTSDNRIYVLANDSDPDNDPITITAIAVPPAHGTAVAAAGYVEYTPEAGYTGPDSFQYQIADGKGGTDTATVTVTVAKPNEPPIANGDAVTTPEDTSLAITLTGTDPDGDDGALTYHVTVLPLHGSLVGVPPDVVYTPALNYNGLDAFTFLVNDHRADSAPAVVVISVTPVNDPPVADPQAASTPVDTPLPITLSASDVEGDPLTYHVVGDPAHGSLSGTAPDLVYTPDPGYNGPDSFTFKANDGQADSNVATVTVNANAAPVADDQSVTTREDTAAAITLAATDADGHPLTYAIVAPPAHGTLAGTPPNVVYTPNANYNGPDSFTFKANDGQVDSNVATVAITVEPVNDAPTFTVGGTLTVARDAGPQTVPNWATAVSPGPADEAAQTLQITVTNDDNALFQDQPAIDLAGTLTFTPAPGARGAATVTVQAQDDGGTLNGGQDTSAPQTFTITVGDLVAQSPLPYYQNFSAGKPDGASGWEYYSSRDGRVRVRDGQLRMDDRRWANGYSLNEAILHLDLEGLSGVVLTFDHIAAEDERHRMPRRFSGHVNADGVAFSADGVNWCRLIKLTRSFGSRSFDLDAAVQSAGIAYSSDFRIKFQQYDNCRWRWDGRAFDNVRVEAIVPQAIPYAQDFSGGRPSVLGGWVCSSGSDGRVRAVNGQLCLDDAKWAGSHSLNEATLHLDLAGATGVVLQFDHASQADERDRMPASFTGHASADGVAFSADGIRWYRLTQLSRSFTGATFDLDAAVQAAGIAYTSDFRLRFQQYDDCPCWSDGRAFDNIHLSAPQQLIAGGLDAGQLLGLVRPRKAGRPGAAALTIDAEALVAPRRGAAPLEVQALALGAEPLAAVRWDFGDGSTAAGQHATHTYHSAGTYTITLTVNGKAAQTTVVVGDAPD